MNFSTHPKKSNSLQKMPFWTPKGYLSHAKRITFATQKGIFCSDIFVN